MSDHMELPADAAPYEIQAVLLEEIHRPGSTRQTIATLYARAILACRLGAMDDINWALVNGELLDYYKPSGLNWIKKWAWDHHATRTIPASPERGPT